MCNPVTGALSLNTHDHHVGYGTPVPCCRLDTTTIRIGRTDSCCITEVPQQNLKRGRVREMLKLMWTCAAVSMNESSSTLLHSSTWTINCNFLLATVIRINVTQMVFRPDLSWRTRTTPIAEQNRFYSPIHKHKSLRISKHGGFRTAPSKLDMDILPSKTHHVS